MASWDQAANMPPKGNDGARPGAGRDRDAHARHAHRPALKTTSRAPKDEALDDAQRANLREIERDWFRANALPAELVERRALATSRCEYAWRTQRKANDWAGFAANLKTVLEVGREEARHLADRAACRPTTR